MEVVDFFAAALLFLALLTFEAVLAREEVLRFLAAGLCLAVVLAVVLFAVERLVVFLAAVVLGADLVPLADVLAAVFFVAVALVVLVAVALDFAEVAFDAAVFLAVGFFTAVFRGVVFLTAVLAAVCLAWVDFPAFRVDFFAVVVLGFAAAFSFFGATAGLGSSTPIDSTSFKMALDILTIRLSPSFEVLTTAFLPDETRLMTGWRRNISRLSNLYFSMGQLVFLKIKKSWAKKNAG